MPQEVHVRIGNVAKETYIICRNNGEVDISAIMLATSEHLDQRWAKEFDDAFVSAWDIGNYVADYLFQRAGIETCACSTPIVNPDELWMEMPQQHYRTTWTPNKVLRSFLARVDEEDTISLLHYNIILTFYLQWTILHR